MLQLSISPQVIRPVGARTMLILSTLKAYPMPAICVSSWEVSEENKKLYKNPTRIFLTRYNTAPNYIVVTFLKLSNVLVHHFRLNPEDIWRKRSLSPTLKSPSLSRLDQAVTCLNCELCSYEESLPSMGFHLNRISKCVDI